MGRRRAASIDGSLRDNKPVILRRETHSQHSDKPIILRRSRAATREFSLQTEDLVKKEEQRNQALLAHRKLTWFNVKYPRASQFVVSTEFASCMGFLILLNCVMIGVEVHRCPPSTSPRYQKDGDGCPATFVAVTEHLFTFLFVVEFFLRVLVLGWEYYKSLPNLLDAVLVWVTGVLVTWILTPAGAGSEQVRNLSVLRAFRLLRIARVLRLNPEFKEMWLLIKGLVDSMRTLFWTSIVMLFVNYIFGIFAAIIIGDSAAYAKFEDDPDMSEHVEVQKYFQGLDRCLFTLLQVVTGDGWASNIARPILEVQPSMWIFFVVYVAVGMMVLMNLVTAVIVDNALAISSADEEQQLIQLEAARLEEFDKLEAMFKMLDSDGSGEIDEAEYHEACQNHADIEAKFLLLNFEKDEIPHLFEQLDNGDGTLSLDEFVGGLRAMQGDAQGKDLIKMSKHLERLSKRIDAWIEGEAHEQSHKQSKHKTHRVAFSPAEAPKVSNLERAASQSEESSFVTAKSVRVSEADSMLPVIKCPVACGSDSDARGVLAVDSNSNSAQDQISAKTEAEARHNRGEIQVMAESLKDLVVDNVKADTVKNLPKALPATQADGEIQEGTPDLVADLRHRCVGSILIHQNLVNNICAQNLQESLRLLEKHHQQVLSMLDGHREQVAQRLQPHYHGKSQFSKSRGNVASNTNGYSNGHIMNTSAIDPPLPRARFIGRMAHSNRPHTAPMIQGHEARLNTNDSATSRSAFLTEETRLPEVPMQMDQYSECPYVLE